MNGKNGVILMAVSVICLISQGALAATVFVNEIHYDNQGADTEEGVEIAGISGFDLSGWQVLFYNGGNGEIYGNPLDLAGILPEQENGFGTLSFMRSGIQNGHDGIALVDNLGAVVQFLAYEGSFLAVEGPAAGMESVDVGVEETTSTEVGFSLQLAGFGREYGDFSWISPQLNSFGTINTGQNFSAVPLPPAMVVMGPCLFGLLGFSGRKRA